MLKLKLFDIINWELEVLYPIEKIEVDGGIFISLSSESYQGRRVLKTLLDMGINPPYHPEYQHRNVCRIAHPEEKFGVFLEDTPELRKGFVSPFYGDGNIKTFLQTNGWGFIDPKLWLE